jgi:hypothetical protein
MTEEIMTMGDNEDGFYETEFSEGTEILQTGWRLAKSLVTLRDECNNLAPNRSKSMDGTIGDANHATYCSRHNPHGGVVMALDITHDPKGGMDAHALAREIVKHPPKDLAYIISNRQVSSRTKGWTWRAYTGSSSHTGHIHVAVGLGTDCNPGPPYDDTDSWGVVKPIPAPFTRVLWVSDAQRNDPKNFPYMSDKDKNTKGEIAWIQKKFVDIKTYGVIKIDGVYGPLTEGAVKKFQKIVMLVDDGKVGEKTYKALAKA